ncbi:ABC transporter substrate-binding protein [Streptomyces sp. B-S-A8]|uniref:ABC transporter substrate-binding protein n=1 Tax=Streptomyces solicavernae TaxID=3043614 RepID=A0ABT6RR32_9ACTN|nr:ABC transporter substrate-binding protein [Streptomyces sp. B-S-A8]MDI3386897.1 ABC transporter substrate-binding protein [Streptomyces sp. B-S-A8]
MNKRTQRYAPFLAAGLAATTLLTGCGTDQGSAEGPTGEVVVGMSDAVLATDPAAGYDPGSWLLFNNVFQSLLSFPKGGTQPEPDAAEECGFTDAHTRVFSCTLRSGLKFSNGNALTSKDVKFSFDRTREINAADGPAAAMLSSIDHIETPDARTVVFRLKVPDATFPSKIASGAGSIVDHREYPYDRLRSDDKAVGSGPYTLESFGDNQSVFKANTKYRGPAERKNSSVTLKFFHDDQKKLKQAVLDGDIDVAYRGLAAEDIADIQRKGDESGVEVVEGSSAEVQHLVFNMDHPVVGKPGVRKALAYLLDRDALVEQVYDGTATPLYSIIPSGITGHSTPFFDTYGARPQRDKAAAALREEGIRGKVELTLWATPSRYGPATVQEFKAIAGQLNDSGLFDAKVESVPFEQYEKDIKDGKYGVYVKGWVPDYPDPDNFTQPFFGHDNVLQNNYTNNKITDRILPGTAAVSERSATAKDFGELQEIVAEELPILPVWQGKQYAVTSDRVTGVEWCLDASTVFRFWELEKH